MSPSNLKALAEVVTQLTSVGELFTAYDVTTKMRNEKNCLVYHSDVRQAIDDLYANGQLSGSSYTRSVGVCIDSVKQIYANVYHPIYRSVSDYDSTRHQNPVGESFEVDARGRLCVPKSLLVSIGAKTDGTVYVNITNHQVTISTNGSSKDTYTVDASGNVRIGKNTLTRAYLNGKSFKVKIDTANNSIVIN